MTTLQHLRQLDQQHGHEITADVEQSVILLRGYARMRDNENDGHRADMYETLGILLTALPALLEIAEAAEEALGYFDDEQDKAALLLLNSDVREALDRLNT